MHSSLLEPAVHIRCERAYIDTLQALGSSCYFDGRVRVSVASGVANMVVLIPGILLRM